MATGRTRTGNARNAPTSVELNHKPDRQQTADIKALLDAKRDITVRAKDAIRMIGYAPGDDMNGEPGMVSIPVGGVARVIKHTDREYNQPGLVIADWVARGRLDIVDDKEFDKAEPHNDIWQRHTQEFRAKEAKRQSGTMGDAGVLVAGLMEQNRELASRLDKLEAARK